MLASVAVLAAPNSRQTAFASPSAGVQPCRRIKLYEQVNHMIPTGRKNIDYLTAIYCCGEQCGSVRSTI
jgi:hypothetical protein